MSSYKFFDHAFSICPSKPVSDDFMSRLIDFYNYQITPSLSFIWLGIQKSRYGQLDDRLKNRDVGFLQANLPKMYTGDFLHGLDWRHSKNQSEFPTKWNLMLTAACNSLGVLPVLNPEQQDLMVIDPDVCIFNLEERLGFKLDYSGGDMIGMEFHDRKVPLKLLESVCIHSTISHFRVPFHSEDIHILELGAGTGAFAHFMGLQRKAKSLSFTYHTIDLPIVSVLQAYLLGQYFGEDTVWLDGEHDSGAWFKVHGQSLNVPEISWALNHNSLPEINANQAMTYLQFIIGRLKQRGLFYSINQESASHFQSRVFDKMKRMDGMKQIQRSPFWARPGYVDEIWVKDDCKNA